VRSLFYPSAFAAGLEFVRCDLAVSVRVDHVEVGDKGRSLIRVEYIPLPFGQAPNGLAFSVVQYRARAARRGAALGDRGHRSAAAGQCIAGAEQKSESTERCEFHLEYSLCWLELQFFVACSSMGLWTHSLPKLVSTLSTLPKSALSARRRRCASRHEPNI